MNNEKILKKVLPFLRENEEVLDIPKKVKYIIVLYFIVILSFSLYWLTLIKSGSIMSAKETNVK